jgi:hypothetical protein
MADKFVWSGASGGDTGANWENAYSTLMKDWGAEAGFTPGTDFVYVRSTHSESSGSALTLRGTTAEGTYDQARVLCVTGNDTGTDPGSLTTGASVTTTGAVNLGMREKIYIYGVDFICNAYLAVAGSANDHDVILESCRLELTSGGSEIDVGVGGTAYGSKVTFINTDIDFASSDQYLALFHCQFRMCGGSILYNVTKLIFPQYSQASFENLDLSILTGNLLSASDFTTAINLSFQRCKLNASATLLNGSVDVPGAEASFHHCQSGTDSDPAYQMKRYTYQGTVETDTARYRDNGASDGERTNPYSWSLTRPRAATLLNYTSH